MPHNSRGLHLITCVRRSYPCSYVDAYAMCVRRKNFAFAGALSGFHLDFHIKIFSPLMVTELVAEKIAIRAATGSRLMLTTNGDIFLRKSLISPSLPRAKRISNGK